MSEETMPADWVLIEAAKRAGINRTPAQLRAGQIANAAKPYLRALCDMIAKHEQPPVDPDVDAVQRILEAYEKGAWLSWSNTALTRAVAQYKLERAK